MATNWTEGVWKYSTAKLADRLVLLCIADSCGRDSGECWHAVETIARMTNLGETTVHRAIKSLEESGDITITKNGSKWRTNIYHINKRFDITTANLAPSQHDERVPNRELEGANLAPRTVIEPKKNIYGSRVEKKSTIPEDWKPDAKGIAYAKERGVPKSEVQEFRDYHILRATQFTRWDMAWEKWCRNYGKWDKPEPASPFAQQEYKDPDDVMPDGRTRREHAMEKYQ